MNRFCFFGLFVLSLIMVDADEGLGLLGPEKLDWHYTLAVQKGNENYSFSLMKGKWLAFDTWKDGGEMVENRIEITDQQFKELKGKFAKTFERMRNKEDFFAGREPTYAFEEVSEVVTTLEFKGFQSEISDLLRELSLVSKKRLPFSALE